MQVSQEQELHSNHLFQRIENQTDWIVQKNIIAIFGAGSVMEGVKSSRYDSEQLRKTNSIHYAFTQWEWLPNAKTTLIGGARFDENATFASAFSPKLSLLYKINTKRIKLPKNVSNKLTNNPGTANITSHKTISNVIKPTTRLRFFLENMLPKENDII